MRNRCLGMNEFVWLFGENEGETMNNNAFYIWRRRANYSPNISCYFVVNQNEKNKHIKDNLPLELQEKVIFKDSNAHTRIYKQADMLFVTHSYKDVIPKHYFKLVRRIKKPIIYLQHGTLGIKKIGYIGKSYWNNMFRFLTYNPNIASILISEQGFKPYQIRFEIAHPRYMKLLELNDEQIVKNQILWFITWREYFSSAEGKETLLKHVKKVIGNATLHAYLLASGNYIKICLHAFVPSEVTNMIKNELSTDRITVVHSDQIDVMEEIARSARLITDYSSLGFDFTFLKKPVLIYQFDKENYLTERDTYCKISEAFVEINCKDAETLITKLGKEEADLNPFFVNRLPSEWNEAKIKKGVYIDKLYEHLKEAQVRAITIIDCGNVNQALLLKLAESLLTKGYLVELLVLNGKWHAGYPLGLNVRFLFKTESKNPLQVIQSGMLSKN